MKYSQLDDLPEQVDVVIAGGGPTGLFLALDLSRRGVEVVVLEPRRDLDWLRPRAKTSNARTMTHFRRLGLADRVRASAPLSSDYADSVLFCTGLNGHEVRRFSGALQLSPDRYQLQPEGGQQVPQPLVEEVLRKAVAEDGRAALHLGTRFTSCVQDASGCVVGVADDRGRVRRISCQYLVGADGVGSAVRDHLGIVFDGSAMRKGNLGLVFRSPDLASSVTVGPAVHYWITGSTYAGMVGPLDLDGLWWMIVQGYDIQGPQFKGVPAADLVRSLVGCDVEVEVLAKDPWTALMLVADRYRADRVFLAGDAAHSNPPWGGHGYNTGIGDAANLAWKLAAMIKGWGGNYLLDSYEEERRPVAERTIADAAMNAQVQADDLMTETLSADGATGEQARAAAARALDAKNAEFYSLGLVLGYDYARSRLTSVGEQPPVSDPITYVPSTAPGCLLPHAWIGDTSLYDLLGQDFTLLVPTDEQKLARTLGAELATSDVPVEMRVVDRTWGSQRGALLIRPDQHVAWSGSDAVELRAALLTAAGRLGDTSTAETAIALGH